MPDRAPPTPQNPWANNLPHELEPPPGWKALWRSGVIAPSETQSTDMPDGPCIITTLVRKYVLARRSLGETLRAVVAVERVFGGVAGIGDTIYAVARYEVGIRLEYEYRLAVETKSRRCPPEEVGTGIGDAKLDQNWVLVALVENAILHRTVLVSGIDSDEDAIAVADRNAPADSGILRSDPAAGIADQ